MPKKVPQDIRQKITFLFNMSVALYMGDTAGDFIWSMWLGVLVITILAIIQNGAYLKSTPKESKELQKGLLIIFPLIYWGISYIFNALYPIGSAPFPNYIELVKHYFWIIPLLIVSQRDIVWPFYDKNLQYVEKHALAEYNIARCMKMLIKMCLLITFVSATDAFLGPDSFITYAIANAVFFYPRFWGLPINENDSKEHDCEEVSFKSKHKKAHAKKGYCPKNKSAKKG